MKTTTFHPGSIVQGPTLPEPIEVLATVPMGDSFKVIGRGMQTGITHDPVLTPEQLAQLTVSAEGVFTAGDTGGVYGVHAQASGLEAIAEVRITTKQDERDGKDGGSKRPGKRTISWRGTVPPQKWMNFYTKVLTRFAALPDLKLEVSFQVPLDPDQADTKADEARSGLKELGLGDNVICD